MIKCLFWNINKKNLVQELIRIVWENGIDILMLVEAENLDISYLIAGLRKTGRCFEQKEILPKETGILFLTDRSITVSVYREEKYFAAYKVKEKGKNRLLVVVHLASAMYYSELARNQRANDLARIIEKLEETCNLEADRQDESPYGMAVIGDFNLQPFSAGIIGRHGFNAIMDWEKAMQKSRFCHRDMGKYYYNPMWNLMGKRGHALGTYYYDSDQDDNSFYWYTFDQILLRPELMDDFIWEEFEIIEHIGNDSLMKNNRIYHKKYSDHLPVKFAI